MNERKEKEAIERALHTEQRTLQRQELLKRLWRLSQREKSKKQSVAASENGQTKDTAPERNAKYRDATAPVVADARTVA